MTALILSSVLCPPSSVFASQASLVTPGAPLPMTGLASFLDAAFLSIGSCNAGNSAPANGTGGLAFAGECWINTTSNPWVFNVTPDGTHWVETGTLNASTLVWTPYLGASPITADAPLSGSLAAGVLTLALQYDSNFTNSGSNQLAFAAIASGDLLANAGATSTEPTATTPSAWLDRWCSSSQYAFPQAGASSWACNTISNLLVASTGITLTGSGQVTIALASIGADSLVGNFTGSAAAPTSGALTNCSNALTYSTSTHSFGCNTSGGTGTVTEQKNTAGTGLSQSGNCDNTSTNATSPCSFAVTHPVTASAPQICDIIANAATSCNNGGSAANNGTYTTPSGALWLEITLVGAGGGGGGGNHGGGSNGSDTCWNTSGSACTSPVYDAGAGSGGGGGGAPASGGSVSGSGTCGLAVGGGQGAGSPSLAVSGDSNVAGGNGGASTLGGNGVGTQNSPGGSAAASSGSGGAGGGISNAAGSGVPAGAGGGAGATCRVIISSPASSYTYTVGSGGGGGSAGSNGFAGGSGAAGHITVEAHFNY